MRILLQVIYYRTPLFEVEHQAALNIVMENETKQKAFSGIEKRGCLRSPVRYGQPRVV